MRPREGDLISGKYRLVRLIGEGGMGSVFEARHEFLGTRVALKFLHPELAKREGLVARFLQEAHVSATIKNPHIAHVTDVDQAPDGAAYLVMELLEGRSLAEILKDQGRLPIDLALDYTVQILAGLDAAHAIGVVHRDLKPDNVFVVPTAQGPVVKLLDFGVAKLRSTREFQSGLTRPGVVMGTPEYMAPEQAISSDGVDARSDVYAVGVILYEMLSGHKAVEGDDVQQIAAFALARRVTPLRALVPEVPEMLAHVVHRAMAPLPDERWRSASELCDALTPFCGMLSAAARIAATPPPAMAMYSASAISGTPAPTTVGMHGPMTGAGTSNPGPVHDVSLAPTLPPVEGSAPGGYVPARFRGTARMDPNFTPGANLPTGYGPPGPAGYGTPSPGAYGTPGPGGYGTPGPGQVGGLPAYGTPTPGPTGQPVRRARGMVGWIVAVAVVAVALGVVGAVLAWPALSGGDGKPVVAAKPTAAPPAVVTVAAPSAHTASPAIGSPPPAMPTVVQPGGRAGAATSHPSAAPRKDAGASTAPAAASTPGASAPPPPGFPFPTTLPSALPSALPFPIAVPSAFPFPLPSGFPAIPGLPVSPPSPGVIAGGDGG